MITVTDQHTTAHITSDKYWKKTDKKTAGMLQRIMTWTSNTKIWFELYTNQLSTHQNSKTYNYEIFFHLAMRDYAYTRTVVSTCLAQ